MSRFGKTWRDNPFYKFLKPEALEHASVVEWLEWVKPGEYFHPFNEGKRTPFEQYLYTVLGGKKDISDFIFFDHKQGYCGLVLELKPTGTVLFNKDGSPRAAVKDQWDWLQKMKKIGWKAELVAGKENARKIIADYYGIKI